MKKSISFLFILLTVLVITSFSCQNHLLPSPKVETTPEDSEAKNDTTIIWSAPENLVATHGLKQKIELNWKGVKNATRYFIYEAATPYDKFIQVAETTSNTTNYVLDENSGASKYYKITAVKKDGEESPFSTVAHGTTLANPVITYIGQDEENSDSASSVHWFMNNCNSSTYQENVRYTITCFDPQGNNVAEKIHNGNSDYPSIKFDNLTPNTNYTYQVTAYIVSHQNDTEISDKVDSATARRLRPNPPENLVATLGTSTTENTLTFDLPAMVDVALGNGIYEPKPIYFKIYRRIASEEATENDWQIIESKFATQDFASQYEPGQTVSYKDYADKSEIKRGIMYEYKVQSYADETTREISSNLSYATTQGFLMAVPKFEITNIVYTDNELTGNDRQYVKVEANHTLTWDNFGTEEDYNFIVKQERSLLEGDGGDDSIVDTQQNIYSTIEELNNEKISFDLSSNPENTRGYYKYSIYIVKKGETDINNAITSTSTIGKLLITNDVDTPKVKFFSVTNNYKDKIIVEWDFNSAYRYKLVYIEDGSVEENPISQEEMDTILKDKVDGDTISYTHITEPGTKRSYKIYPTSSQTETNLPILTGSTLATPELFNENLYHEKIQLNWPELEADSFEIIAKYQDSSISNSNPIETVNINVEESKLNSINPFEYTFNNPTGFDNVSVSGLPIDITLTANKQVTKQILKLENVEAESIEEMYSISDENLDYTESTETKITTKTVGPALVNSKSFLSGYTDKLELTWNKIQGATAYAIIRTQYTYTSNKSELYQNTQKYLIKESNDAILIESPGSVDDNGVIPANVKVTLKDGVFTLSDHDINNPDNTNSWQISQSQISWGTPYEYVVIPLVSDSDMPEYDTNNSRPTQFVLPTSNVTYNNLPYARGSTIGYGWNVSASKGWQTTTLKSENSAVNNSIYITWENPCISSGLNPTYNIYRRIENGDWESIATEVQTKYYEDTTAKEGIVYEYQVGLGALTGKTNPSNDSEYILHSDKNKDSKYTTEKLASGFKLPLPKIKNVSRDARPGNTELITWHSVSVGDENNRMIDGYAIDVYNNNIDASWHEIAKFEIGSDLDKAHYEFAKEVDNASGLLKVLRDYKHYFRVRAFTKQDGKYCYSPTPDYTWSDGGETEFVKWGCRQITAQEFCKMANLVITYGLKLVNGTDWHTAYDGWPIYGRDADVSSPSSGKIRAESNFGVTEWDIMYTDYTQALTTKTNNTVKSLTVNGTLNPQTTKVNNYPNYYDSGTIKITSDAPNNLYDGSITYSGLTKSGGSMSVTYNGTSSSFGYSGNSPLPFTGDDYHHEDEEWK